MDNKLLSLIVFFLPFSIMIHSQDTLLTVNMAVEHAFNSSPALQQMKAELDRESARKKTETGLSTPEISYFREGISTIPDKLFDEQRIAVSQEIDFPLTTIYRLKAVDQELRAIELNIRARERDIKARVKKKYIDVVYALYLQESREEQLAIAVDLYNAVFTKMETGMATGVDLANAELQRDQAMNALDEAEWILHEARYGLFNEMGLPAGEQSYDIQFSDTLRASDVELSQILSLELQDEQPEYRAMEHQLKAAGLYLKEARSNSLPDIRLSLYRQDYGEGFNYNGFEVGLSIPLWYPLNQKGKINMARAEVDRLGWKQSEVKLNMKKNIEYAWHNYSVSRRIMQRYNETMTSKASRLRSMALRSYQLGELDLLELLNAQQIYINSRQSYLSALRNYYHQLADMEKYLDIELVY